MPDRQYFIYILSNISNSVLYIGVTNNIFRRIDEHKTGSVESFTKKYNCYKLVYYEVFETAYDAITREKQLKGGSRKKKEALIDSFNPTWKDLVLDIS